MDLVKRDVKFIISLNERELTMLYIAMGGLSTQEFNRQGRERCLPWNFKSDELNDIFQSLESILRTELDGLPVSKFRDGI